MADGPLLQKWNLIQAVIADGDLTTTAKLIMGRLLYHHNTQTGRCSPSYQTLADGTALTRRRVIQGVRELEERGWISVRRVKGGDPDAARGFVTNGFEIAFERAAADLSPETAGGEQNDPPPSADLFTGGSEQNDTPGVNKTTLPGVNKTTLKTGKRTGKGNREESLPLSPSRFDEWWLAYPKKVAKDAARKVFDRVVRDRRATVDELITATRRYAAEQAGKDPKYIKHPATWLNGGCWADEPAPRRSAVSAGPSRGGFSALAYVAGDPDDDE